MDRHVARPWRVDPNGGVPEQDSFAACFTVADDMKVELAGGRLDRMNSSRAFPGHYQADLSGEVSVTTHGCDKSVKRLACDAAGVPLSWVVDPVRRLTHVYAAPSAADYAEVSTVRFGQPLAVPGAARAIVLG